MTEKIFYHSNLNIRYFYYEDDDGLRQGLSLVYNYFGDLVLLENYVDGVLNGRRVSYYENGEVESIENYVDGRYEGIQLYFYNDGQIWRKTNYVDGWQHGDKTFYDVFGNITCLESYDNGSQIGEGYLYIHAKKSSFEAQFYENGELEGEQVYGEEYLGDGPPPPYRNHFDDDLDFDDESHEDFPYHLYDGEHLINWGEGETDFPEVPLNIDEGDIDPTIYDDI